VLYPQCASIFKNILEQSYSNIRASKLYSFTKGLVFRDVLRLHLVEFLIFDQFKMVVTSAVTLVDKHNLIREIYEVIFLQIKNSSNVLC
jgi:hypothetical protein